MVYSTKRKHLNFNFVSQVKIEFKEFSEFTVFPLFSLHFSHATVNSVFIHPCLQGFPVMMRGQAKPKIKVFRRFDQILKRLFKVNTKRL